MTAFLSLHAAIAQYVHTRTERAHAGKAMPHAGTE